MPQKKKMPRKNRKHIFILGLIVLVGIFILLRSHVAFQAKKITPASAHVSFSVPEKYTELTNPKRSVFPGFTELAELGFFSPEAKVQEVSDFKNTDVKLTYAVMRPWTPNSYDIPFTDKHTQLLDSNKLIPLGSFLRPDQVTIYTYAIGDDSARNRGKLGVGYAGDVRVDFVTADHIYSSEAIFFKCLDPKATGSTSEKCAAILRMFLGSIKVENATAISSPPSVSSTKYTTLLAKTKRNFDPEERILANFFINKPDMSFSYFSSYDHELLDLPDTALQAVSCTPAQIYMQQDGYPANVDLKYTGRPDLVSILTTDYNNLYYKVFVQDPKLLSLIKQVKQIAGDNHSELKNFFACQLPDESYIVKYNRVKFSPYTPGAQSVEYVKENTLISEIATIDPQGVSDNKVSIALPKEPLYCDRPLAVTTNNIFYMACEESNDMRWGVPTKRYIYKIDLTNKSYSILSSCEYSYTNDSSNPTPITTCQ